VAVSITRMNSNRSQARLNLPAVDLLPIAVAATASLALGATLAQTPVAVLPLLLAMLVGLAWAFPSVTLIGCLLATALHFGIFLKYRLSVGGVPVAAFDALPPLVLVSAISMRRRNQSLSTFRLRGPLLLALVLFVLGSLIGAGLGLAAGADTYQLARVLRVEVGLLLVLVAAVIAGHIPQWRSALKKGLYWAGIVSAVQILFTYVFALAFNYSFWSLTPFGAEVDVTEALTSGAVNNIQTINLAPYTMLPAFALAATRLTRTDQVVLGLILAASAATLSRGFWLMMLGTVVVVLFFRIGALRRDLRKAAAMIGVAAAALAAVLWFSGSLLEERLEQTLGPGDESAQFRKAETEAAFSRLRSDVPTFFFGSGTGIVVEHPGLGAANEQSPILENSALARWLNLTLLSLIACALLVGAAFAHGWRLARGSPEPGLEVMVLPAPFLALGGLFSSTLFAIIATGPIWLVAGTILRR
jgi:hypothetical protein